MNKWKLYTLNKSEEIEKGLRDQEDNRKVVRVPESDETKSDAEENSGRKNR